jgi:hypothetical protein
MHLFAATSDEICSLKDAKDLAGLSEQYTIDEFNLIGGIGFNNLKTSNFTIDDVYWKSFT